MPLCATEKGKDAIAFRNQPKFVDASERREPNLEGKYASISSLCRGNKFISRLNVDDKIIYITKKGNYTDGINEPHWNLTAILKTIIKCENHEEAAEIFKKDNLPLPSNLIVEGNPPLDDRDCGYKCFNEDNYRTRAKNYPTYFICDKLFLNLNTPPIITDKIFMDIFKEIPGTQNPREITEEQYEALIEACKIKGYIKK